MKISELIICLQDLIASDGDLEGVKIGSDGCVYIPAKQGDDEEEEDAA